MSGPSVAGGCYEPGFFAKKLGFPGFEVTSVSQSVVDGMWYLTMVEVEKEPEPVRARPHLLTYRGVRVDLDDALWDLYLRAGESGLARKTLYDRAGGGGWDDVCEHCPRHRYEHGGADHWFVSEEQ